MPIYALGAVAPSIDPSAFVAPEAVVIGAVSIGAEATIWPGAVLRGDSGRISIGARTSVQDGAILHVTAEHDTVIGPECTIGHVAHLEGCVVGAGVLVGSGAVVLPGAVLGAGCLVGAGAVVPSGMTVPERAMALGVPAKLRLDAVAANAFADGVAAYVAKGQRYRAELRRIG